jgi:glycosyltransferase involved in cell wall biosynthesis
MKNADKTFVLNELTVKHLTDQLNIPKEKICFISNGVNTDRYTPLKKNDPELVKLQEELNLQGKKIFVQIGSICDRKNQLNTVQTLLPLLKEDNNIVIAFAGGIIDHEYFQSILDLSKNENIEGQVRYLGEVIPGENLNKIYNLAEASIFNSKSEAFGLVIIESLSAGTPVLISSELFDRLNIFDPEEGGIIRYKNETELYSLIKNQIIDLGNKEKNIKTGRSFVEKNYSWDAITDLYLKNLPE